MVWLPLLAGAGIGLAKSLFVDKPQAEKQRKLAAATAAYSPWTGMTPQQPKDVDYLGPMLQGGMTGAMLGQAAATAGQQEQLAGLQQQYLKNQNKLMQQQLGGGISNATTGSMLDSGGAGFGLGPMGPNPPAPGMMAVPQVPAVKNIAQVAQNTQMNPMIAQRANPYLTPQQIMNAQLYGNTPGY